MKKQPNEFIEIKNTPPFPRLTLCLFFLLYYSSFSFVICCYCCCLLHWKCPYSVCAAIFPMVKCQVLIAVCRIYSVGGRVCIAWLWVYYCPHAQNLVSVKRHRVDCQVWLFFRSGVWPVSVKAEVTSSIPRTIAVMLRLFGIWVRFVLSAFLENI